MRRDRRSTDWTGMGVGLPIIGIARPVRDAMGRARFSSDQ
jgi:hypothetical protein